MLRDKRVWIKSRLLESSRGGRAKLAPKVPQPYLTKSVFEVVYKSEFPHKSVNLFFSITNMKHELTSLGRRGLLQNDFFLCVKPCPGFPRNSQPKGSSS